MMDQSAFAKNNLKPCQHGKIEEQQSLGKLSAICVFITFYAIAYLIPPTLSRLNTKRSNLPQFAETLQIGVDLAKLLPGAK